MKLIELISGNFQQLNKLAFIKENVVYRYAQLHSMLASMICRFYHRGLRTGQRVVLIADHDEAAVLFLAAASALGIEVVMPYNLSNAAANEWGSLITHSEPDWIVYLKQDEQLLEQLIAQHDNILSLSINEVIEPQRLPEIRLYEPQSIKHFLVLFTSGTTGKPKAISVSEDCVVSRILSVSNKLSFHADAHIWMSGLMNNTTGVIFSMGALHHGASLIFPINRIVENWPKAIDNHKVTHLMLRPGLMRQFLEGTKRHNADLSSIEVMAYGAAPLERDLLEKARSMIHCKWVQGYGLSETYGPFCWLDDNDHQGKRYAESQYCIGKPDDTMSIKIEEGHLLISSNSMMEGYYDPYLNVVIPTPEWFDTGDIATQSEDGYLNIKGRSSLMIMTEDGHQIHPEEIEAVSKEIESVKDALLVNYQQPQRVANDPVLCLVTELPAPIMSARVSEHFRRRLSQEKWPKHLALFKQAFPLSANDKVDRQFIATALQQDQLIPFKKARSHHENSCHS